MCVSANRRSRPEGGLRARIGERLTAVTLS
jgi:hypothetical protein